MTEIVPFTASSEDFDLVAKTSNFLPRFVLFGTQNKAVKAKLVKMGEYALQRSKTDFTELGESTDVYVLAWRAKAIRFAAQTEVVYDPRSPAYQEIDTIAKKKGMNDCVSGPEFLLYLPGTNDFATWHMSSPTLKGESKKLFSCIAPEGQLGVANLTVELREAKIKDATGKIQEVSWFAPVIRPNPAPTGNPPDVDELAKQIDEFKNPKAPTPAEAAGEIRPD